MHRCQKHIFYLGLGFLLLLCAMWLGLEPVQAQAPCEGNTCVHLPLVVSQYDATWRWGQVLTPTLTVTPSYGANPLMAVDHQGRVHILYETSTYAAPRFIYHTYLSASGWTSPTAVAESLGTSSVLFPPVVAPDGTLHLLWLNRETTSTPYRTLYAAFRNDAWSPEEEVYRSPQEGTTLQGMVHLDTSGQVHATMVDSYIFSSDVSHVLRGSSGWGTPQTVSGPQYHTWVWPDQQGGVRVYANDYETPPNFYYSYWRSGQFETLDQRGPDPVSVSASRLTQLDGANNLHLFWSEAVPVPGGQVTGLHHQCIDTALRVDTPDLLTGDRTAYSWDAVKAAGFARWTALAWHENSGESAYLAMWDGCKRTDLKPIPFPSGTWSVKALAVGDAARRVCVLGYLSKYPASYHVLCADVMR